MCALNSELEVSKYSSQPTRKQFLHVCEVFWKALNGELLLLEETSLDLIFVCLDVKYTFCC